MLPVTRTPEEILQKLMHDSDANIRLRAVSEYFDLQKSRATKCPVCEARADAEQLTADFLAALTDEEVETATAMMDRWNEFREAVYARLPKLRPDSEPAPAPPAVAPTIPEPRVRLVPKPQPETLVESEPDDPKDDAPRPLPRERYAEVGLIELKGGFITHVQGDEVAQKILSGEIPEDVARAQHEHATHSAQTLAAAARRENS
jgi:hypothetical protein